MGRILDPSTGGGGGWYHFMDYSFTIDVNISFITENHFRCKYDTSYCSVPRRFMWTL